MMPALGCGSRPTRMRRRSRSAVGTRSHGPSRRHLLKECYTVCQAGGSVGRKRQAQPVRKTEKMALRIVRIVRRLCRRGRPREEAGQGKSGRSTAHSASLTSVRYVVSGVLPTSISRQDARSMSYYSDGFSYQTKAGCWSRPSRLSRAGGRPGRTETFGGGYFLEVSLDWGSITSWLSNSSLGSAFEMPESKPLHDNSHQTLKSADDAPTIGPRLV